MLHTHILLSKDNDEDVVKRSAENLREAKENFQEKTARIIDKGRSSEIALTILRTPIVIILIIVAIVLVVFFLYTTLHVSDESYKIENYEALWNQSLADFRSGNSTIDQYCINRVHDEDFCNRYWSLQYFD